MDDKLCPHDQVATLLLDAPGVDVASVYVGQVIADRYVIDRKIGKGGFGAVFAARQTGTGQEVAIKCLNTAGGIEDVTLRRFFQEARVTSALRHPNTIHVFDFGQDDTGLLYLAMELLSGRTLKEELAQRRKDKRVFSEEEAIHIGVGILRSLAEAHGAGLVHRDLKPDNVFLHEVPGEEPIIKVLDFGIVKLGDSTLTMGSDSGVPGTPAFMSPEQVTRQHVDGRSDLYSLGCLLYQLVSGKAPLRGQTAIQTLYMHVHEQAGDLRRRTKTPLTERFVSVVHRALEKDPSDRFPDAKAMRTALERCLKSAAPAPPERDPTRLARQPSLFTGLAPGYDESDASMPDISKQYLPRPPARSNRLVWMLAATIAATLGLLAALLFQVAEATPPAPAPVRIAPKPPVEVAPAPTVVAPVEPPPAVVEPVVAPPEPVDPPVAPPPPKRRTKPRTIRRVRKERPVAPPKDEILDEKI